MSAAQIEASARRGGEEFWPARVLPSDVDGSEGRPSHWTDTVNEGRQRWGRAATVPMVESVGYEGRTIDEFIADLTRRNIDVLVDVRLNAVSRRRGFSKTALDDALDAAGIKYLHLRALGNPKENRPAFGGENVATGRAIYRQLLDEPAAAAELEHLADLAKARHVAVMCFERDEQHCHRKVVIDVLTSVRVS
jgi:uncharacterized protein (DUF488 family)